MPKRSDDVKSALRKREPKTVLSDGDFLSTGSTLLNLAASGRPDGGYAKGTAVLIVGDSSSGKSWTGMTALAEAALNPDYRDYRLIYDHSEHGVLFDVGQYFGDRLARRLESPAGTRGKPKDSSTLEEFYFNLDNAIKADIPFVWLEDSMDALVSEDEIEHFDKAKKAHEKGKDAGGSYGTAKAKMNSSRLRVVQNGLRKTNSILIMLSQTRDNIGFAAQFTPKTRSGGKALRFYARLELWTSVRERLKKRVMGQDRQNGFVMLVDFKKNHVTGWEGKLEIPFYKGLGIDDVGANVRWLVAEGHWKQDKGGVVTAPEFAVQKREEDLIRIIQAGDMEGDLRDVVTSVWRDIEKGCEVERKKRYV